MADKFKVYCLGKLGGDSLDIEKKELAGVNAELEPLQGRGISEDELISRVKDADAILGGGGFTRKVMESMTKCRIIATYSVGFDYVDVDAATDCGIIVVNNPASEWCVEEVSNQAITLLLACAKKLCTLNNMVKEGRWGDVRSIMAPMSPVHAQTLGLVGCGEIARMAARKAQGFNLKLIGYDPYLDKAVAAQAGITLVSLPELLKESDFVSVHAPLSDDTFHLIGEKEFKQMKPTAYIINTARGKVIDEQALIKALREKLIAGAGLDVFEQEPIDSENPLLKMDNVIVTPHSASYSDTALKVQAINPSQEVARVLGGHWPNHPVNRNVKPKFDLAK
ncbi:C-terminal binding protein [Chloroflexota bacterium]